MSLAPQWGRCEVAVPGSRSRGDVVRSILLIVAALMGLVAVRWSVTGELSRPIVAPAPTVAPASTIAASYDPPRPIQAAAGTRLSLGGREPAVVDPATGSIRRISPAADQAVSLFRQGSFTVLVADGHASAVPAGQAGPRRPLGPALQVIPARATNRAWLVDTRSGPPEQHYDLVEVGLADGRRHTHWTLPYRVAPVAVVPSGVVANDSTGPGGVAQTVAGFGPAGPDATFVDARGDRVALRAETCCTSAPERETRPWCRRPGERGLYGAGVPVRGRAALRWARSPPADAGWPCTPSRRPRSPDGIATGPGRAELMPGPGRPPTAASPSSAGLERLLVFLLRPTTTIGACERASGPRARSGWTATSPSTPSPRPCPE